jgi:hypothetical protein
MMKSLIKWYITKVSKYFLACNILLQDAIQEKIISSL